MNKKILYSLFLFFLLPSLLSTQNILIINQYSENIITLPIEAGIIKNSSDSNTKARIESLNGLFCLGYWSQKDDYIEWKINITNSQEYIILLETACPGYTAGGKAYLEIDNYKHKFVIPETSAWDDFQFKKIEYKTKLTKGNHTLKIVPIEFKSALMNIRDIYLISNSENINQFVKNKKAVNDKRKSAYIFLKKGENLEKEKDNTEALKYYKKAIELDKSYGMAYKKAAAILKKIEKYSESMIFYKKGISFLIYDPWILIDAASIYAKLGDYNNTVIFYENSILLFNKLEKKIPWWVYNNIGVFYLWNTDPRNPVKAVEYYKALFEGDYKDTEKDLGLERLIKSYKDAGSYENYIKYANLYIKSGLKSKSKGDITRELGEYYIDKNINKTKGYELIKISILYYTKALNEVEESQFHSIYFNKGKAYKKLEQIKEAYNNLKIAYELNKQNSWYKNEFYDLCLHYGVIQITERQYDTASNLFKQAILLKPGKKNNIERYLYVIEKHKNIQKKPVYQYKILAFFIMNTDVEIVNDNKNISFKGMIEPDKIEKCDFMHELLKIYIEALTDGKVTIVYDKYRYDGILQNVNIGVKKDGYYYYADTVSLENTEKFLFENRNNYDTIIYYWRAGDFISVATGGGYSYNYIPYTYRGPLRGMITMPSEWINWNMSFVYLHELWHNFENLINLSPMHAWNEENIKDAKKKHPGWKGSTEWSWYLYHLEKTFPVLLKEKSTKTGISPVYKNINFRIAYPDKNTENNFNSYYNSTKQISKENLIKAWKIKLESDKIWNKDKNKAYKNYLKGLEYNNYQFDILKRCAYYEKENKNYEKSINYFSTIIKLLPDNDEFYKSRGDSYNSIKEYKKALNDFNKALEFNPDYVWAYTSRAGVNFNLENYNQAIEDYSKAIELKPDVVWMYNNRGYYYHHTANKLKKEELFEHAIADYRKAIELDSSYKKLYDRIAGIYEHKKMYREAINELSKLIELLPEESEYYYKRGNLYLKIDEKDKAINDYKKSMKLGNEKAKIKLKEL